MVEYNTKGRQIHKGPRGGEYVLQGGRKVYKFERAAASGPSGSSARTPPKAGFTKTPYTNARSGRSIYKKESSGRYYARTRVPSGRNADYSITLNHLVRNASGTVKPLRSWLSTSPPRRRRAPSPPASPAWTSMGYVRTVYETIGTKKRVYKKNGKYYYSTSASGIVEVLPSTRVKDTRTGDYGFFADLKKKKSKPPPPPPPPRRAPSPPRSTVINYNALFKRNTERTSLSKIRRLAKNWLGKNVPADASYKRIALIIHPDKGDRMNPTNQAKRTTLFKYLSQIKM